MSLYHIIVTVQISTSPLPMCIPITPKLVSGMLHSTSQYLHEVHPLLLFLLQKLGFLLRRQVSILQLPHSWTSLKDSLHPTAEVWDTSAVGETKGGTKWVGPRTGMEELQPNVINI